MPSSIVDQLPGTSPEFRRRWLHRLQWVRGIHHFQVTPRGDWRGWVMQAGRGSGKTRTGAEDVVEYCLDHAGCRYAIVAPTYGDARDICIEGESGVLSVLDDIGIDVTWNRSLGDMEFPNRSKVHIYGAKKPDRLRGPQHHRAWLEELASWDDVMAGDALGTTFNNLMLGLRLGDDPRYLVTTTPKPVKLLRELTARDDVVVTRGSSYDNLENLAPGYHDIIARYEGTRIGRQEILGELLEDVEGALWVLSTIDASRWRSDWGEVPPLARVIVGVDPSGGSSETSGHTGIVVAGRVRGVCPCGHRPTQRHYLILGDHSIRDTPAERARAIITAYDTHKANRVVGERNYGGDNVEALVRQVARDGEDRIVYDHVNASRGKAIRAEPVATAHEQLRVHIVGSMPQLEDQLTTWTPDSGWSPDRLDAMVFAVTALMTRGSSAAIAAGSAADRLPSRIG